MRYKLNQYSIEAEEAKNKIKELKLEIIIKRRRDLERRHQEEVKNRLEFGNNND
jgi:hypothetical protein